MWQCERSSETQLRPAHPAAVDCGRPARDDRRRGVVVGGRLLHADHRDRRPGDVRLLVVRGVGAAPPHRVPAADDGKSARGASRERFLVPGARGGAQRSTWRNPLRDQRARRHAARRAAGLARGHRALTDGHGGDRRGRVRLRRAAPAAPRQPRRRAAARTARRTVDGQDRGRHQPVGVPRRQRATRPEHRVSRRQRTVAGTARRIPTGRIAAHARRAERRGRSAAAAGARGVAPPDSRARPRAEQFARANQIDCRQPRQHRRAGSDARRLAR